MKKTGKLLIIPSLLLVLYGGIKYYGWSPNGKDEIRRYSKYYESADAGSFLSNFDAYRDTKISKKINDLAYSKDCTNNDIEFLFDMTKNDREWRIDAGGVIKIIFLTKDYPKKLKRKIDNSQVKHFIDILEIDNADISVMAANALSGNTNHEVYVALDRALQKCIEVDGMWYQLVHASYANALSEIGGWGPIKSLAEAESKAPGVIFSLINATRTREQKAWVYRFLIDKYKSPTDEQKRHLRPYKKDMEKLKLEAGIYDALPLHIFY